MPKIIPPTFSSRMFMVSGIIFKWSIHFEFIFVYGVRKWSSLILPHGAVQFSQHYFLKKLPSLQCLVFTPSSRLNKLSKLWLSFWALYPAPLACGSVCGLPAPEALSTVLLQYHFKSAVPPVLLLTKNSLAIWGLRHVWVWNWSLLRLCEACRWCSDARCDDSVDRLGSVNSLPTLILPAHEPVCLFICLCRLQLLSTVLCSFLTARSFSPWAGLFLGTVFLLIQLWMGLFL